MQMTAGVTKSNEGIEDITWNILGQIYVPKQWSEHSFSWHATLPPGTFVPPHIHPEQDEFIYVLEGKFDLILDGSEAVATPYSTTPKKPTHACSGCRPLASSMTCFGASTISGQPPTRLKSSNYRQSMR